jgi:tetratricopeptide (TPR) repeat protein
METLILTVLLAIPLDPCPSLAPVAVREEAYRSYVIGQIHANDGRFAEALEPLSGAIRADPLLPQARYALGQALMGLRRFPEAVEAFSAARDVFRCLAALGAPQRAEVEKRLDLHIRELHDAIRSVQSGDQTSRGIAWKEINSSKGRTPAETTRLVHQLEQRLAELVEWKRRGLDPRAPAGVAAALGTALFQAGKLPDAEREFLAALAVDPKHGDAHHNLAVVYLATDRIAEAEQELKLAEKAGIEVSPALREAIRKRKAR